MGPLIGVLNSSEGTLYRLRYDFIYDINIITSKLKTFLNHIILNSDR